MDGQFQLLSQVAPEEMGSFILYASLLIVKILLGALLTTIMRVRTGAMSNPEDFKHFSKPGSPSTHPDVVRVQRMHMNDIENIVPFLFLGLLFCMCCRDYPYAIWLFRIFFLARVLHSVCHFFALQPYRTYCYVVAMGINMTLASMILHRNGMSLKYI